MDKEEGVKVRGLPLWWNSVMPNCCSFKSGNSACLIDLEVVFVQHKPVVNIMKKMRNFCIKGNVKKLENC